MTDPRSRRKGLQINRRQALQSAAGLSLVSIASIKLGDYASATDAGEMLWSTDVDGWFSSPTVIDETVFLGGRNGLHAVDADTGDKLWYWKNDDGVPSSPQVVDGAVYVGSRDSNLYALNAETGTERWGFDTNDEILASPTVSERTVYVGSNDSSVYAVNTETGEQQWSFVTGDKGEGRCLSPGACSSAWSPVIRDDTVFVSDSDFLWALDAETGEELWRSDAEPMISSPTVVNGTVYVGGQQVRAVDSESGETLWNVLSNQTPEVRFRSTPTVADGTVFIGSEDAHFGNFGRLYALDAETGDVQWQFETDEVVVPSPTVASGVVFAADNGGNVFAFDAETGDRRWTLETGSATQCSPTVVDGTLFVETGGMLHAIDAGVDGDSDGSRVQHGTLGHHEGYTGPQDPSVEETFTPTDTPTATPTDQTPTVTPTEDTPTDETPTGTPTEGTPTTTETTVPQGNDADGGSGGSTDDGDGPGFGVLGALAGLGAAGYLSRRLSLSGSDADEQ